MRRTLAAWRDDLRGGGPEGFFANDAGIAKTLPPAEIAPGALEALRTAGYEIHGELGRGGMGVVYLARKLP